MCPWLAITTAATTRRGSRLDEDIHVPAIISQVRIVLQQEELVMKVPIPTTQEEVAYERVSHQRVGMVMEVTVPFTQKEVWSTY